MDKENKIKIINLIIIIGFFSAVFFHYFQGIYYGKPYPYNTFLFIPEDRFNDFYNTIKNSNYLNHDTTASYFPFSFFISNIFRAIKPHLLSFIIFQFISIVFVAFYFWKNLKLKSKIDSLTTTFILLCFSYPFLFTIDRANFEIFVFIFLSTFVYLYKKGEVSYSLIPLAAAISMKLFPVVFLVLLFSDRKYNQILFTILIVFILSLCSLLSFEGGLIENCSGLFQNLKLYTEAYAIGDNGLDYGNSLFGPIKILVLYGVDRSFDLQILLKSYSVFIFIIFSFIVFYITFINKEFWKKVALLMFSMCLFPYVSADYKLIHVFIPLFMFINQSDNNCRIKLINIRMINRHISYDVLYTILFALLLIPKNYRLFDHITDGVYLNPLIMSIIVFVIIFEDTACFIKNSNVKKALITRIRYFFEKEKHYRN